MSPRMSAKPTNRTGRPMLAVIAAALLMSSCSDPTGPAAELKRARRRWADQDIESYQFTLASYCGGCVRIPTVRIIVGNRSVEVRDAATGEPIAPTANGQFPVIDELFDLIESAMERGADELVVEYDPIRGYPLRIQIDYSRGAADDEYVYTISNFLVL